MLTKTAGIVDNTVNKVLPTYYRQTVPKCLHVPHVTNHTQAASA